MQESILFQEIMQQPAAIERLVNLEYANVVKIADNLRRRFKYIMIAARGTSDNAARYAQYLFQIHNRIPVMLATPSVFSVYQRPPQLEDALVIAISQSGKSPDIISVVEEAKRQGRPSLVITNGPDSTLSAAADAVIPLQAGIEKAVAATKTYTSSLAALAILSCSLLGDNILMDDLHRLPERVDATLQGILPLVGRMERYLLMERGAVIGRGFNYCTAFEIALKVKELTGVTTVPYSSADFLHGPIASIHQGYPVIAIAQRGQVYRDILDVINKVRALGAELAVISDDPDAQAMANLVLPTPAGIPEWLSPVTNVLPGQILGWQIAVQKGLDPDKPRGLSKITETL